MAMGIVSDSDFDSELDKLSGPSKPVVPLVPEVIPIERGRGEGSTEVPESLRKIIGEESVTNGRQQAVELAKQFGISPSSVSAYGVGATSTATYNERPNNSIITEAREKVIKRARAKLHLALSHITKDKLESAGVRDIAGVAKDMSTIMANAESKNAKANSGEVDNTPRFVVYSPQFRQENHYETVVVKE